MVKMGVGHKKIINGFRIIREAFAIFSSKALSPWKSPQSTKICKPEGPSVNKKLAPVTSPTPP
jgi:hypothetical protein